MKPFNLEEALAGKPVVMRNGTPVGQLTKFSMWSKEATLIGVVGYQQDGDAIERFDLKGHIIDAFGPRPNTDLFMKSEKKTGWVVVYKTTIPNSGMNRACGDVYTTKQLAEHSMRNWHAPVTVIEIEWEE